MKLSEEEFQIGELLLSLLQILQFNAHEIYETRHSANHRFQTAKPAYIGVGLYPTVALFNHDCYPAVMRLKFPSANAPDWINNIQFHYRYYVDQKIDH